ncbi:MAG: NADH-quinone oxidoreductase subunit NuoE [Bacillota bacterium]
MDDQNQEVLSRILSRHEKSRSLLIPIIQEAQEAFGYLPREALLEVADYLGLPPSTVYGVATFYAQFHLTRQGKHKVKVCQGTACHVRGGKAIMDAMRKDLAIKPGETTPDGMFSLERVACVGSCSLAPVVVIDEKIYGCMAPVKITELALNSLCQESKPQKRTFKIKRIFKMPVDFGRLKKPSGTITGLDRPFVYSVTGRKHTADGYGYGKNHID